MSKGLTSRYYHSLDAKGRVIMPAKYRERLGEKIWITVGIGVPCLCVYPNDVWEDIENKFEETPDLTNRDISSLRRFIFSNADDRDIDKQGRVLIPPVLREHAGLENEVVLVGMSNHIEIWSRERLEEHENAAYNNMDEIMEHLAALGINI